MAPHFRFATIRAGDHSKDCIRAVFLLIGIQRRRQRRFGTVSIRAGNIEDFAAVAAGHGGSINPAVSFNVVSSASPLLITTGATSASPLPAICFSPCGYNRHRDSGFKWHIRERITLRIFYRYLNL